MPTPTFPPGIKAKLVVPPVCICFTPVVFEKLKTAEAPPIPTEVALDKDMVGLLIVVVPDEAPIFKVEAAPKALMVVAVVLKTEKDEESVKTEVVNVGEVEKTKEPVPVSSVTDEATFEEEIEVVKFDEPSVETNLLAVKPEKVIVPPAERLFNPVTF